jgi:hypothetical protein
MKYEELILISIECIKKYNPSIEGPDSYVDSYLKSVRNKILILYRKRKILMNECSSSKYFMELFAMLNS